MQENMERQRPQESVGDRLKRKLDHIFRPASSASQEAFQSIISVLPEGEMKKSMQMVLPQLKDLLKVQDRDLVIGSLLQRGISSVVFGVFGVTGGALTSPVTGIYGPIAGGVTGVGLAMAIPTPSQSERSRIAIAAKQQEMMLRTSGGKEAAKVFDAKRVDQITQAIIWGTAAHGGAGGVLSQASNPMA